MWCSESQVERQSEKSGSGWGDGKARMWKCNETISCTLNDYVSRNAFVMENHSTRDKREKCELHFRQELQWKKCWINAFAAIAKRIFLSGEFSGVWFFDLSNFRIRWTSAIEMEIFLLCVKFLRQRARLVGVVASCNYSSRAPVLVQLHPFYDRLVGGSFFSSNFLLSLSVDVKQEVFAESFLASRSRTNLHFFGPIISLRHNLNFYHQNNE